MQVQVIGCGEAFDGTGLGNTSCLFSGAGVPSVLFDCGYQIPERLWARKLHSRLDAIAFTHLHADHALGIVPLLTRYWEEKRSQPLVILGPQGTETWIRKAMELGYPGMLKKLPFALEFQPLLEGLALVWNGLHFSAARTRHSVLNFTIRVDLPGGRSFSVSGDGQVTRETLQLVDSVDLHFQELYLPKPGIPTHADLQTLREGWADDQGPRKIVLTHFARNSRETLIRQVERLREWDERFQVAVPGAVFKLPRGRKGIRAC